MALCAIVAIIVATAAYATGENVIASKKYTDDTFQTKISTGNILFWDNDGDGLYDEDYDLQVPGLVAYDSTTGGLNGKKIGILDQETIVNDEGGLTMYSYNVGGYGAEMDNFVPTVRAVAEGLQRIWDDMPNVPYALSWTNTQTAAVNNYSTAFNNTTNNWPSADSGSMVTGLSLANGLALKQNKIPAEAYNGIPGVVTTTSESGVVNQRMILGTSYDTYAILDMFTYDDTSFLADEIHIQEIGDTEIRDSIPTTGAVTLGFLQKQDKIPKSGHNSYGVAYNTNAANVADSWLSADVKGTGLVTRTAYNGHIGERKIFESTDVANYHAAALSQNEKDIQDISIPTVGAMMTAIQNGSAALIPAGTAGNVVTYTGTAGVVGSNTVASAATYNQQTGALTNGSSIANVTLVETEIATRQKKKVCAGWPDSVAVADRTDANCWLWYFPD